MTDDYADRWAKREAMIARLSPQELNAYSAGLSHAYTDVFKAFTRGFADGQDIHELYERIRAQWDDVHATQIVRRVS